MANSSIDSSFTAPTLPNNHMIWAVVCTLFFSSILGVVSFIYSVRVGTYYIEGDYERSLDASKKAKGWAIAGIVLSVFLWIFLVQFAITQGWPSADNYY